MEDSPFRDLFYSSLLSAVYRRMLISGCHIHLTITATPGLFFHARYICLAAFETSEEPSYESLTIAMLLKRFLAFLSMCMLSRLPHFG